MDQIHRKSYIDLNFIICILKHYSIILSTKTYVEYGMFHTKTGILKKVIIFINNQYASMDKTLLKISKANIINIIKTHFYKTESYPIF